MLPPMAKDYRFWTMLMVLVAMAIFFLSGCQATITSQPAQADTKPVAVFYRGGYSNVSVYFVSIDGVPYVIASQGNQVSICTPGPLPTPVEKPGKTGSPAPGAGVGSSRTTN